MDQHNTGASHLMDDIDPDLLAFIRIRVNSFIKWDLVSFFHDNPYTVDTADKIATYVGRESQVIRRELDALAESGVLAVSGTPDQPIFGLAPDPTMRDLVRRFRQACEDRQFRVRAMYHVIRGMQT